MVENRQPKFIHDTYTIVSINPAACMLFKCHAEALIDLDIMRLISDENFRGLARLRMRVMREQNRSNLPFVKYPFLRCDGSVFWGGVITEKLYDGQFETTVKYLYEA